ncbi:hypothetical protein LTR96_011114 [Exophiala xenobiotica]|nr:hypothetical protein LTR72_011189 [Exophiala xenobiotica]KAK5220888.1 hypothetical protein LTR47_011044 [Exophiala xenobiotica]KAK5245531.1 hypothetical protein LTS06_009053 [Exophiala xenobiotica]KAK5263480.1 hypothetical protein LTR96_011114 [Exophiala xenobiotica]KAK5285306.1 hypothetical protein LTR14_011057 [Exophiala xenobiotica]
MASTITSDHVHENKMEMSPNSELAEHALDKVDTVHNDEAVKVIVQYHGEETWTVKEEKQLRRKINWRLMPILCITYGLQYYDKSMLGQAAIFGLVTDLDLIGKRYSWSSSIFYLGFIAGSWPTMIVAQRYPVERVASGLIVVWGICLTLTVCCTNYQGLYAQRFFLGVLESGISPMFMLIVSTKLREQGAWYKKDEAALRMGIWYSMTGFSGTVSPLINYALGHIHGPLSSWKYMYIFAGCLTILWGVALYFILPPDPIRAKGFTDRERYVAVARLRTNNSGVRNTHFKMEQVREALLDPKFWLMFFYALLSMIANGPISTFLPIIIDSLGFSTLNSLLLFIPVGVYAGTMMVLMGWLARKIPGWRIWLAVICQTITAFASLLLWNLPMHPVGGMLFACYILPSIGAAYAVIMGLQVANTAGYTKRSVASAGLYIGYCVGNFIGPLLFKASDAPRYPTAWAVVVATTIGAALLLLIYRFLCTRENNKRNAMGAEAFEHAYEDDLTDITNKQFRYVY